MEFGMGLESWIVLLPVWTEVHYYMMNFSSQGHLCSLPSSHSQVNQILINKSKIPEAFECFSNF